MAAPQQSYSRSSPIGFATIAGVVSLAAAGIFFHDFFSSHGNLIAGDTGDSRFNLAILDHWRAVFHGRASFNSPIFFWPEHDVLGYSDSLFLMALPYTVLRAVRLDYYLSFEITLIVFKLIGFFSMFWLLSAFAKVSRPIALFGAALFTLSNLYVLSIGHAQLMVVIFSPLLCCLALSAWRTRSFLHASLAGALAALMLFTSFYIGWFTIFAGAAMVGMLLLVNPVRDCIRAAASRRGVIAAAVISFAIAIIPFLITYLPVLKRSGGRPFAEILSYTAEPVDIVNVGTTNVLWGEAWRPLFTQLDRRFAAKEKQSGFPPFTLAVFCGGVIAGLINPRRRRLVSTLVGVTVALVWLISVEAGGYSIWWVVFKLVPGAAAIRVPARINQVLAVGLIVAVAFWFEEILRRKNTRGWRVLVFAGAAVLIAEQLNAVGWHLIHRDEENAILSRVKAAPADCKAFLATNTASPERPFYAHQIDAMFASRILGLPTINGYSGWIPPGWNLLMFDREYLAHAEHWAVLKGVQDGLCGFDFRAGTWSHLDPTERLRYTLGTVLDFRQHGNAEPFQAEGWSLPEPGGTWTDGERSALLLKLDAAPRTDLMLTTEMHAFTPAPRPSLTVSVSANGVKLEDWLITDRESTVRKQIRIPRTAASSKLVRIEFLNHDPRSPRDLGLSTDARKVGLAMHSVLLEALGADGAMPALTAAPRYLFGTAIDFRAGGNAPQYEKEGWEGAEPGGTWTSGGRSVLELHIWPPPSTDLTLTVDMHAFTPPHRPRFTAALVVNGRQLAEWQITDKEQLIRKLIRIPRDLLAAGVLHIEFRNHDPRSPADLGYSVDARKLGISLERIMLEAAAAAP